MKPSSLTAGDHATNLIASLAGPALALGWLAFLLRINQHKRGRDLSWPVRLGVGGLPGDDLAAARRTLAQYGIAALLGLPMVSLDAQGRRVAVLPLWVSSAQAWAADAQLRAAGWWVVTAVRVDRRRGSSDGRAVWRVGRRGSR